MGYVNAWIALRSLNQRNHFGSQIRTLRQFLLGEFLCLPMLPHRICKKCGEIF